MNTMSNALATAGVKLPPLIKRVWLWLKDHPDKTYIEVARAINVTDQAVASALTELRYRDMVTYVEEVKLRHNQQGPNKVRRYRAKGTEYELLPRRKNKAVVRDYPQPVFREQHKEARPKTLDESTWIGAPVKKDLQQPTLTVATLEVVDPLSNMTLAEALDLYRKLHSVFGRFKN